MKLLQINTNRSRPAMDIALATGLENKMSAILISEPNQLMIKGRKDWIQDAEADTAIKILDTNIVISNQGYGQGFTYVTMAEYTVYSCYSSGNKATEELESCLYDIGARIKRNREKAIITGDFNAKSPQWGMSYTDKRGTIVTEWIAENGFIIANVGDTPTFQRLNHASILDLTIVTRDIMSNVISWQVSSQESLSDHRYICFEIGTRRCLPIPVNGSHSWQTRKMDSINLEREIDQIKMDSRTTSLEGFTTALNRICNRAMPKRRTRHRNPPVYWWSKVIADARSECMKKRRAYTRAAKKCTAAVLQRHWRDYIQQKKALQTRIKNAKRDKWKELCDEVDADIWGNGYLIVMKGMTGFPPKIRLSMTFTEEIVTQLFPTHEQTQFQCERDTPFQPFTGEELEVASQKLKSDKAPGPGKIPPEILKKLSRYTISLLRTGVSRSNGNVRRWFCYGKDRSRWMSRLPLDRFACWMLRVSCMNN